MDKLGYPGSGHSGSFVTADPEEPCRIIDVEKSDKRKEDIVRYYNISLANKTCENTLSASNTQTTVVNPAQQNLKKIPSSLSSLY